MFRKYIPRVALGLPSVSNAAFFLGHELSNRCGSTHGGSKWRDIFEISVLGVGMTLSMRPRVCLPITASRLASLGASHA